MSARRINLSDYNSYADFNFMKCSKPFAGGLEAGARRTELHGKPEIFACVQELSKSPVEITTNFK